MLKLLIVIVLIYFGLCVLIYFFQSHFIFFPSSLSFEQREQLQKSFPGTEIQITAPDGIRLLGWLHRVSNFQNKPLILYYGGNAEQVWVNFDDLAKFGDVSVLFMNYRGYGASQGEAGQEKFFSDALFIFDKMVGEYDFDPEQVIPMGRSLGTGVAVHVAKHRHVRGLILVSPFDSLARVGQRAYPIFPIKILLRHRFDSISLASEIDAPLLAIAGEEDSIIPLENTKNLLFHWKGPSRLVVIPGGEHNDVHLREAYWRSIEEFLRK